MLRTESDIDLRPGRAILHAVRRLVGLGAAILGAGAFVVLAGAFILPRPDLPVTGEFIAAWVGAGVLLSGIALWFWRRPKPDQGSTGVD